MLWRKVLFQLLLFMGSLGAASMAPARAYAVPASPDVHSLEQPDGTKFNAVQWGDENRHGWETEDGYTVVFEEKMNRWTYARRGFDGSLVGTASIAGKDTPPADLKKRIRPLVRKGEPVIKKKTSKEKAFAAPSLAPSGVLAPQGVSGPQLIAPPTATANVAVVLVNFSDRTTTYGPASFNSLLFGNGNYSMSDYYKEVSYNNFSISPGPGSLAQWYLASQTHNYYGTNDFYNVLFVMEAAQLADAAGFDFNAYDADGDCKVDVLAVVHQGPGQEATGNSYDIWSHRFSLTDAAAACAYYACGLTLGPITTNSVCTANPVQHVDVDDYIIMPEKYGTGISTMGVFAHEYGHSFGLPDLYDTDYSSEGVGVWSLMAAGSWNKVTRPGDRPAHMDAWSKYALGWVTPIQVAGALSNESISSAATDADVYQLRSGSPISGTGEYFLVENRQKSGFDAGLPGTGLLIWHVDENQSEANGGYENDCERFWWPYPYYSWYEDCGSTYHYHVALVQADNQYDLEWGTCSNCGGNRGDAGDPFPGTAGKRFFSASSDPYNNSNLYSGAASNVIVTTISNSGAVMTASMTASPLVAVSLAEAVDNPTQFDGLTPLVWTTGGTGSWTGQELISYAGADAAQSPILGNSVSSSMLTTVAGPASISFRWKVSSQPTYDYVNFTVNGVQKARISGEVNWQQKWYTLAAGSNTLKWTYAKNASVSKGIDAAWVDNMVVSPYTKVAVLSPNGGEKFATGSSQTITWNAPAAAEKFKLYYTINSGMSWVLIADNVLGNTYPWSVPVVNGNKTGCKVKVVAYTATGALVGSDTSNTKFTIEVLRVTAPNGGEPLPSGAGGSIDFTLNSTLTPVASITFYYTSNGGMSWKLIDTITSGSFAPGPNSHPWTIPTVTAAKLKCKVKMVLKSVTGALVGTDTSDAFFTINP